MYQTDSNGNKKQVTFFMDSPVESFSTDSGDSGEKEQGSNKGMLFLALAISAIVIGASGFLLYRHLKKKEEKFGYRLV